MSTPVRALQLSLFDYEHEIEQALTSIDAGWQTIANNLREIHEQALYKAEYGTWAYYCQQRWGKSRQWGYYLLEAAKVLENVKHVLHETPVATLRQALALTALPHEEQAEVWHEAVDRLQTHGCCATPRKL